MDAFVGTWNFVESDNFEAYMKQVGVGMVQRKLASSTKPSVVFEKTGDKWKMSVISAIKTIVTEFELDKEFEETTADGRKCKSTFSLVDGKLIQEQKAAKTGEKDSHFERWIEGDKLIVTGESEGVKYRRVHQKA
uniref:Cytosolic fatty-acid binding proteins domain-containing protein n=1 Tax=Panagrolaimus sp. JU765 TaxID=591449 RepID=A0AC34Q822_9BILA